MWLFTQTGFVSAVADPTRKDIMVVRARERQSLEPLAALASVAIIDTPERDYAHRVFVTKAQLTTWMVDTIAEADYTNYKSRMQQTRGTQFTHALHDVWADMCQLQARPPYSGARYWYDEIDDGLPYQFAEASTTTTTRRNRRRKK